MSNSLWPHGLQSHQASLSVEFSRQEYWSGFPSPGDLPDPGIEPVSPALQADSYTIHTTVFTAGWATVKSFPFVSNLCSIVNPKTRDGPLYALAARPEFSRLFTPRAEVCSSVVLPAGGVVMPSSHLMFQNYKHISNYMGSTKKLSLPWFKKKKVREAFKNKEFNS